MGKTSAKKIPDIQYRDQVIEFLKIFTEHEILPGRTNDSKRRKKAEEEVEAVADEFVAIYEARIDAAWSDAPLSQIEEEYGIFHPVSLAKALLDRRKEKEADNPEYGDHVDGFMEILKKSYPINRETGLYSRQCTPVIVGLASLLAKRSDKIPVTMMEGDSTNLAASNEAGGLGMDNTDKFMFEMCRMARDCPKKKYPAKLLGVTGVRKFGDELINIAFGLNADETDAALQDIGHPEINLMSAQLGVHHLAHTKTNRMPGVGASFACVSLNGDYSVADINESVDVQIERSKHIQGMIRFGLLEEEDLGRYIDEVFAKFYKERNGIPPTFDECIQVKEMLAPFLPVVKKAWEKLIAKDGIYHDEFIQSGTENAQQFFDYWCKRHKEKFFDVIRDIGSNELLKSPEERIPFYKPRNKKNGPEEAPEIIRMRDALRAFGFENVADIPNLFKWGSDDTPPRPVYGLNREKGVLPDEYRPAALGYKPERARTLRRVIDLMRFYDAPDPASGAKTKSHMIDDVKEFAGRSGGVRIVHLELSNLNGLNNISHEFGNAVLRKTHDYMQEWLRKKENKYGCNVAADYIYHEGNGKFKIALPIDYPKAAIDELRTTIENRVAEEISNVAITDFAAATYAPSQGKSGKKNSIITNLEERIEQVRKSFGLKELVTIGQIPHPKKEGKIVRIHSFRDIFDPGRDLTLEGKLKEIDSGVERAIEEKTQSSHSAGRS